ncbi:MAG: type II toxin-antitoxin system RelE/ParE family toxin [Magnetococcales bacterium]|nr:type II toxin-antitoxin system RelE/ParE family toxin [Magnetococcales bacterium]
MTDIIQSATFKNWLSGLKDRRAAMRIHARIDRASLGNFGDTKILRDGVSEMRIDYGPGYRVYFMQRGLVMVVLLAGGVKSSQDADIALAIKISKEWSD